MLDRFDREINSLRISVTDRCNLRCVYCMPESGIMLKKREDILSYEQIEKIGQVAAEMGITKLRLTGGEPLVRRDIESLVGRLSRIRGLNELCLTTNGTRLSEMALKLKENGLGHVNISMDTIDPDRYCEITRGGDLRKVLAGVDAALDAGLTPIKVNMVMLEDTTEEEVARVHEFCKQKGLQLQKIIRFYLRERQHLKVKRPTPRRGATCSAGVALATQVESLRTPPKPRTPFLPVASHGASWRRRVYSHAERPPPCSACNKLRLTADGFFKPCLFSEDEIKVDLDDIQRSLLDAVALKPESGSSCRNRTMCQIGG